MKIPLQSEVSKYMKEKKEWPEKFCDYYAERFWNFYQSNGWKVSGRAAMKDWKAAFNSQWKVLKFKEDIDFLNSLTGKTNGRPPGDPTSNFLNDTLKDYRANYDTIPDERYAAIYDYLKEKKVLKMTPEQRNDAIKYAGGDPMKGKKICIKMIFDSMITNGKNF